jgi:Flp pilus assembly pilin Flp
MTERLSLIVNTLAYRVRTLDFKRAEGQGATEYAIALGFVAVVIAGLLLTLGGSIQTFFKVVGDDLGNLPANI